MNLLEQYIIEQGEVLTNDILKVDSFLNHQIDPKLIDWIASEFYNRFNNQRITKVLTIEASGIAPAILTAQKFKVPLVFAKKEITSNLGNDSLYSASIHSYTHQNNIDITINKKYLSNNDRILIIDDFLANGEACKGLINICHQAKASVVGIGICIEKYYQKGGKELRSLGYHLESIAKIKSLDNHIELVKDYE